MISSFFPWRLMQAYLEIYNEQISDLLNPKSGKLKLKEDVYVSLYYSVGSFIFLWWF
jgi:hypothetical protein